MTTPKLTPDEEKEFEEKFVVFDSEYAENIAERGILRMRTIMIDRKQFYKNATPEDVKDFLAQIASRREQQAKKETVEKVVEAIRETGRFLGEEQIELFHGRLPFVIFQGKADEHEKVIIYRQALHDALSHLSEKLKELLKP